MTVTEDVAVRSLADLEARMKGVSQESNAFANRFLFGGVVAIIALLNTDLIIDKSIQKVTLTPTSLVIVAILVGILLALSWRYFKLVDSRIQRFDNAYRRTKHKYEVLQYGLLLGSQPRELIPELEKEAKSNGGNPIEFPTSVSFSEVVDYLHDHHGRALEKPPGRFDAKLAMFLVLLTVVVKILIYVLMFSVRTA